MLFWIAVAVMTALVAIVLLLPLSRAGKGAAVSGADDRAKELAVYRDQLKEIDRDLDNGLISPAEADYARAEIGRRLIAAGDQAEADRTETRPLRRRVAEMLVILSLPALGVPLYLLTGAPGLPDQPLEARLENPGQNIELLLAKVERHLLQNPEDGQGWELIAPIYYRNQVFDRSVEAYRNAVRLLGPSAERSGSFAEALIALDGGKVGDEAAAQLAEVLKLAPGDARARFYLALKLEQEGKRAEAFAAFQAIRKDAPADAPYLELVDRHVAATDPSKPAPSPEAAPPGNPEEADIAAAAGMEAGDRQQMIMGMVETLSARLKNEPDNFEGWMRLVRSYAVLGMKDKAADALASALKTFPADTDQGRQLKALADSMGIPAAGGM
ncbi:c-type cytochrome biogenesis protein CcmI [Gellertiella hungarica]|uniref:Cytochrome c-type biogenesis protein CcmH n=1 Tax=Gellertiella hungarica TaxID=1572859 RepID=A0A7W6NLL5_9HYPH|nr:c-type cytochrome biogenesis protein CcmI [Gellertiella hungarica]MBB4065709.1 cytochrome c-type biogenesis protein CcmH [Gellertiella hungarica]